MAGAVPAFIFRVSFWLACGLAAVGVPADALAFADLRSITGAVVTLQKHGDPLLANPADPWNRAMNYPRIWLYLFSVLGINDQKIYAAGIAFCVLYLGCVSALILRCGRALDAAILLRRLCHWLRCGPWNWGTPTCSSFFWFFSAAALRPLRCN